MNAISRSALALALLAAVSACGQADQQDNSAVAAENVGGATNDVVVVNEVTLAPAANAVGPDAAQPPKSSEPPAATKIAPVPPKAPPVKAKAKPPAADPHAGHDMGNMSGHDMGNMQH